MFRRCVVVCAACGVIATAPASFGQMQRDPYVDSSNDGVGYETIAVAGVYRNFAPLHIAAARGDVERLKQELAEGVPVDLRVANRGGNGSWKDMTPLMWAAMTGNASCVEELIKAGADVNARSSDGLTPLMAAAGAVLQIGGDELVRLALLIQAGGNIDAVDRHGNCVLAYACGAPGAIERPSIEKMLPHLVDHRPNMGDRIRPGVGGSIGYGIEPRSPRVVMHGDLDRVRLLLQAGADVNQALPRGGSVLSSVVHYTDAARLRLLLDHGANVMHESEGGWNALMVAAAYGDWPCFQLLFEAGSNIQAVDRINGNQTVLIWAIRGREDAGPKGPRVGCTQGRIFGRKAIAAGRC